MYCIYLCYASLSNWIFCATLNNLLVLKLYFVWLLGERLDDRDREEAFEGRYQGEPSHHQRRPPQGDQAGRKHLGSRGQENCPY